MLSHLKNSLNNLLYFLSGTSHSLHILMLSFSHYDLNDTGIGVSKKWENLDLKIEHCLKREGTTDAYLYSYPQHKSSY